MLFQRRHVAGRNDRVDGFDGGTHTRRKPIVASDDRTIEQAIRQGDTITERPKVVMREVIVALSVAICRGLRRWFRHTEVTKDHFGTELALPNPWKLRSYKLWSIGRWLRRHGHGLGTKVRAREHLIPIEVAKRTRCVVA